LIDPFDFAGNRLWVRSTIAWAATLLWAFTIFSFSGRSFGGATTAWILQQALRLLHLEVSPPVFEFLHFCLRKLGHVTEYATFSVLLYFALESREHHRWRTRTALWAILLAGLYSLTDEYHQSLVPGRGPSLRDCGIDTVGAALGMLAMYHDARHAQASSRITAAPSASPEDTKKGVAGE